jgi:XTP/dITP diphosphohydrolase
MTFVIATNNQKKLRELNAILSSFRIQAVTLEQAGVLSLPEETGDTFGDNALIKARAAMTASGHAAIADDSGLAVDALGGRPGVFSARYGAPDAKTDGDRNLKLLEELKQVPEGKRGARFICAAACVFPDGGELVVKGELRGEILTKMSGTGGFGYDPLFYVPAYGMTVAEMPEDLKNSISHRAIALGRLRDVLRIRFDGNMEE